MCQTIGLKVNILVSRSKLVKHLLSEVKISQNFGFLMSKCVNLLVLRSTFWLVGQIVQFLA